MFREIRQSRTLERTQQRSQFDITYNVETDGDLNDWTYLRDLDIESPNWIEGCDYAPIEPERLGLIMSALALSFEDSVFIDYGSGKGRALLIASEFPFKRVIGLEFSPELHKVAEGNIQNWRSPRRRCKFVSSICIDFSDFITPDEPAVLFFFDPCSEKMFSRLLDKIGESLQHRRSELCLVYVAAGAKERLLDSAPFLEKSFRDPQRDFCIYRAKIKVTGENDSIVRAIPGPASTLNR